MTTPTTDKSVSRRSVLAGLGAGGLALAAMPWHAAARNSATDLSTHPAVGVWLSTNPGGTGSARISGDGTLDLGLFPVSAGPDGALQYANSGLGVWEPIGDRGIHFTAVVSNFDAKAAFVGTTTIDGYPVVNEDGMTSYDDGTKVRITIRDAAGNVTLVLGEDGKLPPVWGTRMRPGKPGFPNAKPEPATPAA
jgi:hypothetical protein